MGAVAAVGLYVDGSRFIGPGVRWCAVGTAPCIVSRLPKHHIRAVSWWIWRIAGFFAISLATARRLTTRNAATRSWTVIYIPARR
jgi:hypothetical protein